MAAWRSGAAKMTTDISEKLYLPRKGGRVLCAVSGGADSVCLLHLLHSHASMLGIEVFAAHFEHGIRGEESRRDADFVKKLCSEMGVELVLSHGDTPGYAREKHMGMEEAARTLRYRFLEDTADKLGCDCITTAHNANDNTETVLFNLSRGSGAKGLCGIPRERGRLIRPLLNVTRQEIEAYLAENSLAYVTDSSNLADDYSRNLIRHQAVPVLERINPALHEAVSRASSLLRQDEDCLFKLAEDFVRDNYRSGAISGEKLLSLHPAIASRVLRQLCPKSLEEQHVNALMELAGGNGLGFCDVPGLRVRREQGRLFFDEDDCELIAPTALKEGETLALPRCGLAISVKREKYPGEIHGLFKTYWVKYESICGQLICSSRLPGDKIRPQGRNCTKSLKAIFTEKKMTQRQRNLCPVIRDDKGVLILVGHAVDVRCRPAVGDEALRIEILNWE